MSVKKVHIFIWIILLLSYAKIIHAREEGGGMVEFRPGSDILYDRYANNFNAIAATKETVSNYEDVILSGNGHIRLVASLSSEQGKDPIALNMAALRAAVVRNFIKQNFRMLTNWNFTFYVDAAPAKDNSIEAIYIPEKISANVSSTIYYTEDKRNMAEVKLTLSKYGKIPYLIDAPPSENNASSEAHFQKINSIATNPIDVLPKSGEPNPAKMLIAIHYRWDRDNLDSLYLSNSENLHRLDSILSSGNSKYIDTLTIVAYASPEGSSDYNQRLSQRRATTIKNYITDNYKSINPERIITQARGENWEGLRKFALNDSELPFREQVLSIINSSLSDEQKQSQLTKLDAGKTYYRYILPNYYRYLRNGASVLITYSPDLPKTPEPVIVQEPEPTPEPEPVVVPVFVPETVVKYPLALRTNMLFDIVGGLNIGVEVPIGKHFSVIGDFAYSYWQASGNKYALQTLEGGVEGRYWFGVKDKKIRKNEEWAKPLRGWNVGVYGMYCSRYDVQFKDGYQGDGFWSAGVTAGYAMPVARNLSIEFSLAAGYFYTPEYRHYHAPEFDADGKYHLMWQQTGSFGTFSLTKARVSLVWLIRSEKRGGVR